MVAVNGNGNGNGLFYPIVGFASFVAFIYMSFGDLWGSFQTAPKNELSFVERNGTQFLLDGKPFYINGWNSYWLMDHAVNEDSKPRIRAMLKAGSKMGLTVCRTWAFNDGAYHALQLSPGRFDERVFRVNLLSDLYYFMLCLIWFANINILVCILTF